MINKCKYLSLILWLYSGSVFLHVGTSFEKRSKISKRIAHMVSSRDVSSTAKKKEFTIEVAVFVDYELYEHWERKQPKDIENEIRKYVFTVIENANILLNDPSLGYNFSIAVVKVIIVDNEEDLTFSNNDAEIYLRGFCNWQEKLGINIGQHWDHAILFTGLNLKQNNNNSTMGLSFVHGMCTKHYSCTIVEGFNFVSVFTLAHEIGHSLGMDHDKNECEDDIYIMASNLRLKAVKWSPCSKKVLDLYFRGPRTCISTITSELPFVIFDNYFPGERYSSNQQCKVTFGDDYYLTYRNRDICQSLYCTNSDEKLGKLRLLEGTACKKGKWCWKGHCIQRPEVW